MRERIEGLKSGSLSSDRVVKLFGLRKGACGDKPYFYFPRSLGENEWFRIGTWGLDNR